MMRDCIKGEPEELELMDKWYIQDENTVPPVYILQPISSILTNFNNKVSLNLKRALVIHLSCAFIEFVHFVIQHFAL